MVTLQKKRRVVQGFVLVVSLFFSPVPGFAGQMQEGCDRVRPEHFHQNGFQPPFSLQSGLEDLGNAFKPFSLETLYGPVLIDHPVIAELLTCPAMERLKHIHQYGVFYFVGDIKWFSRYEHSVGVFKLLNQCGASLEEQIVGLLHDVSHTVFSHVGEWIFKHDYCVKSYQDTIFGWYLSTTTIPDILKKHGIDLQKIVDHDDCCMFDQPRPDICVDRFEYTLRGGLIEGLLEKKDIEAIINVTKYEKGKWFFTDAALAKQYSDVALYHTSHVWGSLHNHVVNSWTATALHRAMELGIVTFDDIHFSTDAVVWDKLVTSSDTLIQDMIHRMRFYKDLISIADETHYDCLVKTKFSGVDPLVKVGDEFKRLSVVDGDYQKEYLRVKDRCNRGWPLKYVGFLAGIHGTGADHLIHNIGKA